MRRIDVLRVLADLANDADAIAVIGLGAMIDEWHAVRPSDANFFNSAMGSNMPLAMGLSFALPNRTVLLLDTDGSQLMVLGSLCTMANYPPPNLRVFVMDNESYAYTGGQPTATAGRADLGKLAEAAGISRVHQARDLRSFKRIARKAMTEPGLAYVVAKIKSEAGVSLPRGFDRTESKYRFVRYVERTESKQITSTR